MRNKKNKELFLFRDITKYFTFYTVLSVMLVICPIRASSQVLDSIEVYFAYAQFRLPSNAKLILDKYFINSLNSLDFQNVRINGYCDRIGSDFFNDKLSMLRAHSVTEYLIGKGLSSKKIKSINGYGKRYPINNNKTKYKRAQNRRVTILYLKTIKDSVKKYSSNIITKEAIDGQIKDMPKDLKNISKKIIGKESVYDQLMDSMLPLNTNISLPNVNFYAGRHIPLEGSHNTFREIIKALQHNSNLKIVIEGYVCCTPDYEDGMDIDTNLKDLSEQRAKFIYDYLIENEISKQRLSYVGYGGKNKLFPEERDFTEQALNRRVEIRVIAK